MSFQLHDPGIFFPAVHSSESYLAAFQVESAIRYLLSTVQAPKTCRSNREFELYPNSHVIFYLILSKPNTYKEN